MQTLNAIFILNISAIFILNIYLKIIIE